MTRRHSWLSAITRDQERISVPWIAKDFRLWHICMCLLTTKLRQESRGLRTEILLGEAGPRGQSLSWTVSFDPNLQSGVCTS